MNRSLKFFYSEMKNKPTGEKILFRNKRINLYLKIICLINPV